MSESCGELIDGANRRDSKRFGEAFGQMAAAARNAGPGGLDDALARLVPVLAEIPYGVGAGLASLTGAMAGSATDAGVVLPVVLGADRVCRIR